MVRLRPKNFWKDRRVLRKRGFRERGLDELLTGGELFCRAIYRAWCTQLDTGMSRLVRKRLRESSRPPREEAGMESSRSTIDALGNFFAEPVLEHYSFNSTPGCLDLSKKTSHIVPPRAWYRGLVFGYNPDGTHARPVSRRNREGTRDHIEVKPREGP